MTPTNVPDTSRIDRFALSKLGYDVRCDRACKSPDGQWYWTMTRDGLADVVASKSYFKSEEAAWSNADAEAREWYPEGWFEPYYLTQIVVEVVSETDDVPGMDLATLAREMIVGDLSGKTCVTGHWRLSAAEAATELEAQGSNASFFSMLEDVAERSSFMRPSPEKAFAQSVRTFLRKHAEAAVAGRPAQLDAMVIQQLMDQADAIINPPA